MRLSRTPGEDTTPRLENLSFMRARLDETINIANNPALFGNQRVPGLVSLCADRTGQLHCYRRMDDQLVYTNPSFRPYLWLTEQSLVQNLDIAHQIVELQGRNPYRYLVTTDSWNEIKALSKAIADRSGVYPSHPDSPQLFLSDQVTQFLLATGQTYYNKMAIEELHTLVLRVYTAGDTMVSPGEDPERIVAIATLESNGDFQLIEDEEAKILWRLTGRLKKIDPDLIQGHEIFNKDLVTINERAKLLKVKMDWGRTGKRFSSRKTRMQVAEKSLEYQRFEIEGREIADSWMLSVLHDVSGREMVGFELEEVAQHFGLEYGKKGEDLQTRARKDTQAIATLHRTLAYPYFLQAQIFPLSFQDVVIRGNATLINHLFLREYYRLRHSIPIKPEPSHFAGGLTAQEHSGCAFGVYHCDVASLYPSLILTYDLGPEDDELKIFTGLLGDLRDFRLKAKTSQREAKNEVERGFFGGLQTTFKILINSFYGYLGFAQGHFADFAKAAEVTRLGRELLTQMIDWLKDQGGQILEVDTDGIYFIPSPKFRNTAWIEHLNSELPEGITVEFDGRYRAMYCHKMKNYALLAEDDSLILRGSGLRSRAVEPFLRRFIEEMIGEALREGSQGIDGILEATIKKLEDGQFEPEELSKTDTLIDSPSNYAQKISSGGRNRAAVYELALAADRDFRAGESISYYVTGSKQTVTVYDHCKRTEEYDPENPDINLKYYLKKLKQTHKKFAPILSQHPLRSPIPFAELPPAQH